QLEVLKDFFASIDFVKMRSDINVVRAVHALETEKPQPIKIQALVEPGVAYAIYFNGRGPCEATVDLPAATYRAEWINPSTGAVDHGETLDHSGGQKKLRSPSFVEDIALRIKRSR